MSAKPKPRHKAHDTNTWTVIIDAQPTPVTATALDLEAGSLVFTADEVIVKAVAPAHWSIVDLTPPPEPPEE